MSRSRIAAPATSTLHVIGLDLGGTKCAVSHLVNGSVVETLRLPTGPFEPTFEALARGIEALRDDRPVVIGVSCGGPLDAQRGIILSPPNLAASWHGVPIVAKLVDRFGGTACLMNDANACALAEWRFGAGQGTRHMVFLTSGTGMGSGLILNGELYEGASGDAGEIGHVRLDADGPLGFGKRGSVEGFTSGGGIARLAEMRLAQRQGSKPTWCEGGPLTAKHVFDAARAGDRFALEIIHEVGARFGASLALVIDLFNPERIVLGGFFPLGRDLLEPSMLPVIEREALPSARAACRILPAELGETIGSHGAVAAALHGLGKRRES